MQRCANKLKKEKNYNDYRQFNTIIAKMAWVLFSLEQLAFNCLSRTKQRFFSFILCKTRTKHHCSVLGVLTNTNTAIEILASVIIQSMCVSVDNKFLVIRAVWNYKQLVPLPYGIMKLSNIFFKFV